MNPFRIHDQASPYESPWSLQIRVKVLLWEVCWAIFCGWTPKPLNRWRIAWLSLFGASIVGKPFVHGRARIIRPWNLTLHDRACLGDGAVVYCLDHVELGQGSTIAQEAYLCTGTHEFSDVNLPLKTAPIIVGRDAFVGLRAIVMPGVTVAATSVIGAGAVLTRDTVTNGVYGGNPARQLGTRRVGPAPAPPSGHASANSTTLTAAVQQVADR